MRKELDEANRRIDALERQLRASRQLQVQLAAVTDLAAELLLPQEVQDTDALVTALRKYRKESL